MSMFVVKSIHIQINGHVMDLSIVLQTEVIIYTYTMYSYVRVSGTGVVPGQHTSLEGDTPPFWYAVFRGI